MFNHINIPVQFRYAQALWVQTKACQRDTVPYFYDRCIGILYMHYHINMITYDTALLDQSVALVGESQSTNE